jgi:hypothetical protein
VGVGNKFLVKNFLRAYASSGLAFNQEQSTNNNSSGVLIELPFIVKFDFFKYKKTNLQLSTTQSVFYNLTQKNRVRYDGSTNVSWEIINDFSFNTTLYTNYDSHSPATGTPRFDYGIVFGLSYKF